MSVIIFYLLASFFISLPVRAEQALPVAEFDELLHTRTGTVENVIAPDLVQFRDGSLIRLTGLYVPDYQTHESGPLAITAMKILEDVLTGQRVKLYQTKDPDWGRLNRMGQSLGHLSRAEDGIWAQGTLVRLGLAQVKTAARNPEMSDLLYALEDLAREENLGLWQNPENHIKSAANVTDEEKGFVIVEGQIESTATRSNRIYLNFGADWRTDFTASIAPEHKRRFSNAGLNPLNWNGRRVRVRGYVRDYNGPYMEISHPSAIQFPDTGMVE